MSVGHCEALLLPLPSELLLYSDCSTFICCLNSEGLVCLSCFRLIIFCIRLWDVILSSLSESILRESEDWQLAITGGGFGRESTSLRESLLTEGGAGGGTATAVQDCTERGKSSEKVTCRVPDREGIRDSEVFEFS